MLTRSRKTSNSDRGDRGYVTSVCFGEPLCEPLHTAAPTTALLFSLRGASRAILDLKGCVNASCSYLKEKAMLGVIRLLSLTVATFGLLCFSTALPTNAVLAQQQLAFKVTAENTQYTQQHTIDVGDVSGHQIRVFEIRRRYPSSKAPS